MWISLSSIQTGKTLIPTSPHIPQVLCVSLYEPVASALISTEKDLLLRSDVSHLNTEDVC